MISQYTLLSLNFYVLDVHYFRSNVSIRFRTEHGSGVIIYMSSDSYDFYTAFMKDDGRIVFKFNCGNGESQIETVERFNDGRWHTVSDYACMLNTIYNEQHFEH